jgi:hypothetical protein
LNIGVVGVGRIGSIHTRNLARLIPEGDVVGICDIRLDVAQALGGELEIGHVAGKEGRSVCARSPHDDSRRCRIGRSVSMLFRAAASGSGKGWISADKKPAYPAR